MLQKRSARGYRGRKYKTFGKFGALGFNENKMVKTSGGDVLVCRTEEEVRRPFHLQPVFKKNPYYGEDTAKRLFDKGLCLLSFFRRFNIKIGLFSFLFLSAFLNSSFLGLVRFFSLFLLSVSVFLSYMSKSSSATSPPIVVFP